MPVILIPLHFDLDVLSHAAPCQRSVVLRPFVTSDFMTGVAAQPGKHLPEQVGGDLVLVYFKSSSVTLVSNESRLLRCDGRFNVTKKKTIKFSSHLGKACE